LESAGLIKLEDKQVALMHASYFANIAQYDYRLRISHRWSVSLGNITYSVWVDDILNTTELTSEAILTTIELVFFNCWLRFTFYYARKLPVPGFQYGVNAKIIRRVIGKFADSYGWIWQAQFEKMIGIWFND
jgi:hypothetical protein